MWGNCVGGKYLEWVYRFVFVVNLKGYSAHYCENFRGWIKGLSYARVDWKLRMGN